jgi:hypothetical protein
MPGGWIETYSPSLGQKRTVTLCGLQGNMVILKVDEQEEIRSGEDG